MNYCAPIGQLCKIKDVDESLAERLQAVWKAPSREEVLKLLEGHKGFCAVSEFVAACYNAPKLREIKRQAIDKLLDTFGIEFLGLERRTQDGVFYANAGDTYATTIVFKGHRMLVSSVGDVVERNQLLKGPRYSNRFT